MTNVDSLLSKLAQSQNETIEKSAQSLFEAMIKEIETCISKNQIHLSTNDKKEVFIVLKGYAEPHCNFVTGLVKTKIVEYGFDRIEFSRTEGQCVTKFFIKSSDVEKFGIKPI